MINNLRNNEIDLMDQLNILGSGVAASASAPPPFTANDFLNLALPPVTYDERPANRSGTSRANPRIPQEVQLWSDFSVQVDQFQYPENLVVDRRSFHSVEEPIQAEKIVDHYVHSNIIRMMNFFLKDVGSDIKFTANQMPEFKGVPDYIACKENLDKTNSPYSFVEVKTIWDLPTPPVGESLIDWWHADADYERGEGSRRAGKSIFDDITRVYTYLCVNNLRYAALTTYERTWFLYRPQAGSLFISEAYDCQSVLRGFCYLLSLMEAKHSSEPIA
ncbi:hypothetical protein MIR68_000864 [Amoeboaphelidium protococcarum]|nr:hypothetical protein MIR68_011097 [Amoeboaphelidium protococcarum]KAI3629671.1 hypothetical protein MIR68_011106 [Amoeboaphelidium protococcarum]KAI3641101.1 hypothetical protein MIR68_000864 [Amoeboaphelidium protococcarum]